MVQATLSHRAPTLISLPCPSSSLKARGLHLHAPFGNSKFPFRGKAYLHVLAELREEKRAVQKASPVLPYGNHLTEQLPLC